MASVNGSVGQQQESLSPDPEPQRSIGSSRGADAVHTPPMSPLPHAPPARSPSLLHFAISIWTLYASGQEGEL